MLWYCSDIDDNTSGVVKNYEGGGRGGGGGIWPTVSNRKLLGPVFVSVSFRALSKHCAFIQNPKKTKPFVPKILQIFNSIICLFHRTWCMYISCMFIYLVGIRQFDFFSNIYNLRYLWPKPTVSDLIMKKLIWHYKYRNIFSFIFIKCWIVIDLLCQVQRFLKQSLSMVGCR